VAWHVDFTVVANEMVIDMQQTPPSQSSASSQCDSLCVQVALAGSHIPEDPVDVSQQKVVAVAQVEPAH
jgi:hypothetical protein